jgi:hypothetical protein
MFDAVACCDLRLTPTPVVSCEALAALKVLIACREEAQTAAVEAAILASNDEARKRDQVLEALERDLQAARYVASRAHKQYAQYSCPDSVPSNHSSKSGPWSRMYSSR